MFFFLPFTFDQLMRPCSIKVLIYFKLFKLFLATSSDVIAVLIFIYFILFYFILFYFILFYFILFYFILFYFIIIFFIIFLIFFYLTIINTRGFSICFINVSIIFFFFLSQKNIVGSKKTMFDPKKCFLVYSGLYPL